MHSQSSTSRGLFTSLVAGVAALATSTHAQPFSPNEVAKLLAGDGAAGDTFGYSVSVSGDIAVIGARLDDGGQPNSGSAYVFRFDGTSWTQEAKLLASDRMMGDLFGHSAWVFGNVAVIGAPQDDDNGESSGSAYVFRFDGANWAEEAKLVPSDGTEAALFGWSISVSDDRAVIGALEDGAGTGAAYVYQFDGTSWAQEAKLLADDGTPGDWFGRSVSISDTIAMIGARWYSNNGPESGSAYAFRFDGENWAQEAKLLPADGATDARFGTSVSVLGNTAVIGAPRHNDNGDNSGSAYIYQFDGANWTQEAKLLASDGATGDWFGRSVSMSGSSIVVGAQRRNDNGATSGSAYIFDLNFTPRCLADVNGDGMVTPSDFTAWINAFNNQLPECDQNDDGSCTPADFTAWIANFNAGC